MKVRTLLDIVEKIIPILEYYQDWKVNDMLDDIYQKSCTGKPVEIPSIRPEAKKAGKNDKLPPQEAAALIIGMDKMERREFLGPYFVREMQEIADCLQLKYKSNIKRAEIIELIAGYEAGDSNSGNDTVPVAAQVSKEHNPLGEAAAKIVEMQQEDIIAYLDSFKKKEILEIARQLNLKLSSSYTKNNLITLMAKHIGFKEVNRRIAQRPRSDRFSDK